MFKGRIWLWVIVIAICFVAHLLITYVPTWFSSDDLTIQINVSTDSDLGNVLANEKVNGFKLFLQSKNADIIISDDDYENIEGYTKYDDCLWSPLVLYACGLSTNNEGFIKTTNNSACYKVDLYNILLAMEKNADWESLGVDEDIVNGKVTIYIPREESHYYDKVVELFYLTLNNGRTPTETERAALKNRVEVLLNKCNKVADISQSIYEESQNPSETHKVFIGPEYLFRRGSDSSMSTGYDKSFRPVYFLNTVYLTADLYVKDVEENALNFAEKFVDKIRNKRHFMQLTGWRIEDSTFDLSSVSGTYFANP